MPSTATRRRPFEQSQWVISFADHASYRFDRLFSAETPTPAKKVDSPAPLEGMPKVEVVISDEMDPEFGIATGVELQELIAEKQGKKLFDLDAPRGPFGTKEHPAIIQSRYDERIVGCSGGVGEDEHDVVWFKLKKGELYECTVCTQIFQLEVVGLGGPPGGHHH